jgi:hypothetical protein
MSTAAGICGYSYFRPLLHGEITERLHVKDGCCWAFSCVSQSKAEAEDLGRLMKRLHSSRVTKDDAATIRQTDAFAAHSLLQQRLHALQPNHHKTEFAVFLLSEALPSCRGGCSFTEPVEEGPDFRDGKPRLPSKSDENQVELCLRRETPLAALPESWREDSRLLIEANRRGAKTCTPGDFSNSHFSLDLKCALRISISYRGAARTFNGGSMMPLPFKQLPLTVRIAVGVVFYNAWWSIEEFVIDRHGLWKYMPYYKVADPCIWDLAVGVIITLAIWRASGAPDAIPGA